MFRNTKKSDLKSKPSYSSYYSKYFNDMDRDESYYSGIGYKRPSLFDRVKFYEKPDLIKPTLHFLDESKIDNIVRQNFRFDDKTVINHFENMRMMASLRSASQPGVKSFDQITAYISKIKNIYEKFPKHMMYDIFKLYYNQMEKMQFADRNANNKTRYKLLEVSNNPIDKIMTNGSNLKSAVFTKNIMLFLLSQFAQMDLEDPKSFEKIKKLLDDKPNRNKEQKAELEKMMDNMLSSDDSKQMLNSLMEKAASVCANLDANVDLDTQDSIFNNDSDDIINVSMLNESGMMEVAEQMNSIKMQTEDLKKKIKHLVDRSISQFDAKTTVEYEDFINSSDMSNLDEYALLHPQIRSLFIEDIMIPKKKTMGKVDVYLDVSGSMRHSCGLKNGKNGWLSKREFARGVLAKLYEMKIIRNFYLFDTSVVKKKTTLLNICLANGNGGTSINTCVRHVNDVSKINSIIITDAEDRCSEYSDKVFFLGLAGARFHNFSQPTFKEYSDGKQMVIFDGKNVTEIH